MRPHTLLVTLALATQATLAALAALAAPVLGAAEAKRPSLAFENLRLIEEIDCGKMPAAGSFREHPGKVSKIEPILGRNARTLPNPKDAGSRYFAYLVGRGKNLQAGKAYFLAVDFADNAPRSFFIRNRGEEITRGLFTGTEMGDAMHPRYVSTNGESLDIPLSNAWDSWQCLFFLHARYQDAEGQPRQKGHKDTPPPMGPKDGFWVMIGQMEHKQAPLSKGAAVSRIRLYEAPSDQDFTAKLNLPPASLPHRHLFWREEMSDGVVGSADPKMWAYNDRIDWFENKARRMKFLGMNTYAIDLLEFGSNQGWDSGPGGGNDWYYQTPHPDSWERILGVIKKYDFEALPYYEYHGSIGVKGLGKEKRAKPLSDKNENYTHIAWSEKARANLLDPDTAADLAKLFDLTIVKFKDRAKFLGAWLRPRNSGMPISFAESDLALFSSETGKNPAVTRKDLQSNQSAYQEYIAWWYTKRRDFLVSMQAHLAKSGVGEAPKILFTTDPSEPGMDKPNGPRLLAENGAPWKAAGEETMTPKQALAAGRHRNALTLPVGTWGGWEWQHSSPVNDPQNYKDVKNVALTYTFSRLYTVDDAKLFEDFTGGEGLAMVRHFSLNENMMNEGEKQLVGYFVADFERPGPYIMASEATAMARGNPFYLGYLSSARYAPGFPQYVRAFNQAYLALPALPGKVVESASSNPNIIVREIPAEGQGTYYAVVNLGRTDQEATLNLPAKGAVTDAAENSPLAPGGGGLKVVMYPFQLRALHVK